MFNRKHKSISILVVEDNPLDALIVKTLLQPHFNLEVVTNGNDAMAIIEEMKFDIILMDINLGDDDIDGIVLMKKIRQNKSNDSTKIFAVTAYAESSDFFIEQGFDELYIKPVIKEEIFEFINKNTTHNISTD